MWASEASKSGPPVEKVFRSLAAPLRLRHFGIGAASPTRRMPVSTRPAALPCCGAPVEGAMRRKLRRHVETVVLHFGDHDSPGPGGIITEKQLKHAEARERREAELRRVTSRMRKSGWRCLEDIATNYGLGEEADIYRLLLAAMRAGKFDEFGVLFLNADPRA